MKSAFSMEVISKKNNGVNFTVKKVFVFCQFRKTCVNENWESTVHHDIVVI